MVPELLVRADAGPAIGIGHAMRCLALAEAWRARGGIATFIGSFEGHALRARLDAFSTIAVPRVFPDPADAELLGTVLASKPGACVVIDGYEFDRAYQASARCRGHTLLVVDDIGHLPAYSADFILNQNIGATAIRYNSDARLLLGPTYAMLRPEFMPYAGVTRATSPRARRVLVTLGGSDPADATTHACRAIIGLDDPNLSARVVVGPSNPRAAALSAIASESGGRVEIVAATDDMPALMASADVAVCAGGSTAWELAFMGVPAVIVTLAENQRDNALRLSNAGIAMDVGEVTPNLDERIATSLGDLVNDENRRQEMSRLGRRLVDGRGASRVASCLWEHQIE